MKKIRKNLKWITLVMVMIIILGGTGIKCYLLKGENEEILVEELEVIEDETIELDEEVVVLPKNAYVDIKGAVNNPGVYEIAEDKKVIDVVELAGGFTGQANTSLVNLAKKVSNEMVIIIYTEEEVQKAQEDNAVIKIVDKECVCPTISNDACLKEQTNNNKQNGDSTITNIGENLVNINVATIEELLTLSGIGESKAEAIIKYRDENGLFKTKEDIMKVSGIGETLYEKIKDYITI